MQVNRATPCNWTQSAIITVTFIAITAIVVGILSFYHPSFFQLSERAAIVLIAAGSAAVIGSVVADIIIFKNHSK